MTKEEKVRQFWKYNINPITGWRKMPYSNRSSVIDKTVKIPVLGPKNRFTN